MKTRYTTIAAAAAFWAAPALAHLGPDAAGAHLAEHLLIALAVALAAVYGLMRLWQRPRKTGR